MRKPKSYIKHPVFKNPDVLLCLERASRIFTTCFSFYLSIWESIDLCNTSGHSKQRLEA